MQVSEVSHAELLRGAMRVCDLYGDGAQAREDMRADCLTTPPHLCADLLDHFTVLQKLHSSSADFFSGFHAGFYQNGDDQVETTLTITTESTAEHAQ